MDPMADNQPRDDHAKQLKKTVSSVKQLRGWMASDPTRTEEFVDALNAATGLRLLSRAWAEAAPEATEAVTAADRLVSSRGPVGPYTPMVDAARYVTALTHVATIQRGMHLDEASGRTMQAALSWKDQLTRPGLAEQLDARTTTWVLLAMAQHALATGDLAAANAWADAALRTAREGQLGDDQLVVLLDALRTSADARWAVNLPEQSLALLDEALDRWRAWTRDDLAQLPRMARPHLERLVAPAFALMRDRADRLEEMGRIDESLEAREELSTLLHRSAARRGENGRIDLALARSDQAWSLADTEQEGEALRAAEDAQQALNALLKAEKPVGQHLPTQLFVAPSKAHAELAAGRSAAARKTIDGVFSRLQAHPSIAVNAAARAVALMVRAEVSQAEGADASADLHAARAVLSELRSSERDQQLYGHHDPMTALRALARGAQLEGGEGTPHWEVPDPVQTLTPRTAPGEHVEDDAEAMRRIDQVREQAARERAAEEERQAAERAEQERLQQEARHRFEQEQAERDRLARERAEAEAERERQAQEEARALAEQRAAEQERAEQEQALAEATTPEQATAPAVEVSGQAEQAAAERARLEAEHAQARAAQETAARAEQERLSAEQERAAREEARRRAEEQEREAQERAEAARLEELRRAEAEAARIDPLDPLREQVQAAEHSTDKKSLEVALEALVAALEPAAEQNPGAHGAELVQSLERLSSVQGWWGGRAAGKRAKQLAKQWGL